MIVITGGSSGIGLELAKLYKAADKKVVNVSGHVSVAADVNIVYDLRDGDNIVQAAHEVIELDEPIEAVINCIGAYSSQGFGEIEESEVKRIMATNLKAPMLFVSELLDSIKKSGADVLNVISTAAVPNPKNKNNPVYVASKWAERGFTLSLQDALKETSSRVISFCPGGIQTDLFKKAGKQIDTTNMIRPEAVAQFIKQILDLPKNMEVSEVIINLKGA